MAEATNPIPTASNPRVGPAPCVPDCSAADHLDYLSEVIVQCVKNDGVRADALGAIEAVRAKAASAPTPPDRVGEEVGRAYGLMTYSNATDRARLSKLVGNDVDGERLARVITDASQWAEYVASAPSPEAGAGGDLGELDDVQAALKDCSEAVAFFDQVKRSTQAEQIAVGADHWNWLEAACRRAADVHRSGKLVASTGSGEETKGEPSGTGSREPGPSVPASGFDPSRGWRPIWDAPKGRDENGILQQVLLIGSYPTNGHHTDIVQSWWCPVGSADVDGYWERWRHAFPPSHWMPVPAPPSVRDRSSEAAETSGSAEGKSPADLSATPEATPQSSPSQTPVDPQMTVEEARGLLDRETSGGRTPWAQIKWLKMLATQYAATTTEQHAFRDRAARIEAALAALAPSDAPSTTEAVQ